MKKTYIIPQVLIVRVAQTLPLMGSTTMVLDDTQELSSSSEILTKQNNYSVWGDDWSAE